MQRRKGWWWPAGARACLAVFGVGLVAMLLAAGSLSAEEMKAPAMEQAQMQAGAEVKAPPVEHPMMKPAQYTDKGACPNCGMMLNMWARTRYQFKLGGKEHETCSLHCLAERVAREGAEASDVKVALYLEPEKMVPAEQAVFVIGSSAPGTMSAISKLAFADKAAAEKFAAEYGGEIADYKTAYQQALAQLGKDRQSIDAKRKKSGKIVEPAPADKCTVCGMPPAMYPNNRVQILTADKKTLHFCSGHCLINFQAEPAKYGGGEGKPAGVWATVYPEGMYDYAGGLFYVVGSKAMGPMGQEPFAFRTRKDADDFVAKEGGSVVLFSELKQSMIGK